MVAGEGGALLPDASAQAVGELRRAGLQFTSGAETGWRFGALPNRFVLYPDVSLPLCANVTVCSVVGNIRTILSLTFGMLLDAGHSGAVSLL